MGINNISSNDINRNLVGSREKLTEAKIEKTDVIDSVEKPIIPQNEGIIFSLSKED